MNSELETNLKHNVLKVYIFAFFWMFLILIPVIVPYFLQLGLSMAQVFQLQAAFGFVVAIFEVPSGYLCDLWGRKKTLVLGAFFSGLGFTWLNFANTFEELLIFELLIGLGLSLMSGTDFSILYDSLAILKADRSQRSQAISQYQFSKGVAEAIASVIGGLLATASFQNALYAQIFCGWLPFFVALSMSEPSREVMKEGHKENLTKIVKHLFLREKLTTLIFINSVVWGLSTFCAVWIFQKYWQENAIDLFYFGFLWGGYNLVVALVSKKVHLWERIFGPTTLLIAIGILPIMGYLGMGFFSGWLGVIAGLSFQLARGLSQVILKDALNWRVPSEFRATANSLTSLFFRLGFFVIGPAIGFVIDRNGVNDALFSLAGGFSLLFLLVLVPLIREIRKRELETIPTS